MRASRPEEGGLKEKNSVGEEGRRRHRGHQELLRARRWFRSTKKRERGLLESGGRAVTTSLRPGCALFHYMAKDSLECLSLSLLPPPPKCWG